MAKKLNVLDTVEVRAFPEVKGPVIRGPFGRTNPVIKTKSLDYFGGELFPGLEFDLYVSKAVGWVWCRVTKVARSRRRQMIYVEADQFTR